MFGILRRLRRRVPILALVPASFWAWNQRHILAGAGAFAKTVPDRVRLGRGGEVALAAKVNVALLRDPRLKGANVRLGAVQGGDVCLEVGPGADADALADVARRVVEAVPGVSEVRVGDDEATPAASTVAGPTAETHSADRPRV